ncbi:MAG: cytochrome c5 family protein [Betaproteobacteria bacterium]|nr:MAG: cytochrome c5 family protein [Betaproteobacteria bacterium]
MSEEHGNLIKTPKQLIIVSVVALVVPIGIAFLGAQLVTGSKRVDPTESKQSVEDRIRPVGQLVKLDGAAPPPAPVAVVAAAPAKAKSGEEVYQLACTACHGAGIAGAPKTGDKGAWATRVTQGANVLYDHAIKGFKTMPAKGGQSQLTDDEVKAAVDYQLAKLK